MYSQLFRGQLPLSDLRHTATPVTSVPLHSTRQNNAVDCLLAGIQFGEERTGTTGELL
jgi:hypothetical protein